MHKGYSLINIAGLAIGMAICILITLYIQFELSYDRHHRDVHRIYRFGMEYENSNSRLAFMLLGVVTFTSIVAGGYPALFISSYKPSKALKTAGSSGISRSLTRNLLVIVQFAISITFIVVTLITQNQLNYIKNTNAGFGALAQNSANAAGCAAKRRIKVPRGSVDEFQRSGAWFANRNECQPGCTCRCRGPGQPRRE